MLTSCSFKNHYNETDMLIDSPILVQNGIEINIQIIYIVEKVKVNSTLHTNNKIATFIY